MDHLEQKNMRLILKTVLFGMLIYQAHFGLRDCANKNFFEHRLVETFTKLEKNEIYKNIVTKLVQGQSIHLFRQDAPLFVLLHA